MKTPVFAGHYISQSGVKLEYTIQDVHSEDKKEGSDYIVCFKDGAHSAGIAKVPLNTYFVLKGKMFFISEDELVDLKENVIIGNGKWTIKDADNNVVELPGKWTSETEAEAATSEAETCIITP
jgi:hypothetical protein